jgi:hypothetical protein
MMIELKRAAMCVIRYLGNAAHRRFVAMLLAMLATHLLGKALDEQAVAAWLEIAIGGLGGAWSRNTPALPDVPVEPSENVS